MSIVFTHTERNTKPDYLCCMHFAQTTVTCCSLWYLIVSFVKIVSILDEEYFSGTAVRWTASYFVKSIYTYVLVGFVTSLLKWGSVLLFAVAEVWLLLDIGLFVLSIDICNGCGMLKGDAYPSWHLVPPPYLGLACAPIVETRFLELAISSLIFSPLIPLGTFSILLALGRVQQQIVNMTSEGYIIMITWKLYWCLTHLHNGIL